MLRSRLQTENGPTLLLVAAIVAAGLIALAAFNLRGPVVQPAGAGAAAAPINASAQRANAAYSARLEGEAHRYAAVNASAARWQGLADEIASRQQAVEAYGARSAGMAELPSLSVIAYGARWTGLAETYAPVQAYAARWEGLAEAYHQRAIDAYAARWTGLAETYAGE